MNHKIWTQLKRGYFPHKFVAYIHLISILLSLINTGKVFCWTDEIFKALVSHSCHIHIYIRKNPLNKSQRRKCNTRKTNNKANTQSSAFSFTFPCSRSCSLLTSLHTVSSSWHSRFITEPHSERYVFKILLYHTFTFSHFPPLLVLYILLHSLLQLSIPRSSPSLLSSLFFFHSLPSRL